MQGGLSISLLWDDDKRESYQVSDGSEVQGRTGTFDTISRPERISDTLGYIPCRYLCGASAVGQMAEFVGSLAMAELDPLTTAVSDTVIPNCMTLLCALCCSFGCQCTTLPCRPAALPSQAMCESKLEWKLPGLTRSLQCSAIKDVDSGGPALSALSTVYEAAPLVQLCILHRTSRTS